MTTRSASILLPALAALLLVGCADGPIAPVTLPPAAVASVRVSPDDLALDVGAEAPLTATPLDDAGAPLSGRAIVWTSSDTTVAVVSSIGLVSARAAGSATIRAATAGHVGVVAVTVVAGPSATPSVAWIEITPVGGMIPQDLGTSRQLGVIARTLDGTEVTGRPVAWTSRDTTVATVGPTGLLRAHAAGTARIVAEVDGRRDSAVVWVPSLVARIETAAAVALAVGDVRTVAATALDADGRPLVRPFAWATSNPAVATVDSTGRVVATGAGTALLTVRTEGKEATVRVVVTGRQLWLTRAGGAPLPATLHATTTADGRPAVVQVTGGVLRMVGSGWTLRLEGWLLVDGAAPVATVLESGGAVAYDILTGDPLFHEGDEWLGREPSFRGRVLADGRLELDWRREPGTPVVTLLLEP